MIYNRISIIASNQKKNNKLIIFHKTNKKKQPTPTEAVKVQFHLKIGKEQIKEGILLKFQLKIYLNLYKMIKTKQNIITRYKNHKIISIVFRN